MKETVLQEENALIYLTERQASTYAKLRRKSMGEDKEQVQEQQPERQLSGKELKRAKKELRKKELEADEKARKKVGREWAKYLKEQKEKKIIVNSFKVRLMIRFGISPTVWEKFYKKPQDITVEKPEVAAAQRVHRQHAWQEKLKEERELSDTGREKAKQLIDRGVDPRDVVLVDGTYVTKDEQKQAEAIWHGMYERDGKLPEKQKDEITKYIAQGKTPEDIIAEDEDVKRATVETREAVIEQKLEQFDDTEGKKEETGEVEFTKDEEIQAYREIVEEQDSLEDVQVIAEAMKQQVLKKLQQETGQTTDWLHKHQHAIDAAVREARTKEDLQQALEVITESAYEGVIDKASLSQEAVVSQDESQHAASVNKETEAFSLDEMSPEELKAFLLRKANEELSKIADETETQKRDQQPVSVDTIKPKPEREEVLANALLSDQDRLAKMQEITGKKATEEESQTGEVLSREEQALLDAHDEGAGELGKDNQNPAGVYNYDYGQLRRKVELLRHGEKGLAPEERKQKNDLYTKEQRRELMEAGIVGAAPRDALGNLFIPQMPAAINSPEDEEAVRQALRMLDYPDDIIDDRIIRQDIPLQDEVVRSFERTYGTRDPVQATLRDRERNELGQRDINDIDQLLTEIIGNYDVTLYGVKDMKTVTGATIAEDGKYPLFDVTRDAQGREIRREVNQANVLRWVRDRMMHFHGEDPDNPDLNLFREVGLERYYKNIPIIEMLNNYDKYFRSKDGTYKYEELADQIKREMWLFTYSRNFNIKYQQGMGSDKDIGKLLTGLFQTNIFTKEAWGKSTLGQILTMPVAFQGTVTSLKDGVPAKKPTEEGDVRLGAAVNAAYLLYYNLTDYDKLKGLLKGSDGTDGAEATLLNPKKIKQVWEELADDDFRAGKFSSEDWRDWIGNEEAKSFLKKPSEENLIAFLNIFSGPQRNPRLNKLVRELVKRSVAEKYELYATKKDGTRVKENIKSKRENEFKKDALGQEIKRDQLDGTAATYAENWAFSMVRWTGAAARNDTAARGYDAWTKFLHLETYRAKQSQARSGGAFGNPYTLRMFKGLGTTLFEGIRTEPDKNKDGEEHRPLEIMERMERAGINRKEVLKLSNLLFFPENTMQKFTQDHFSRVVEIFQQVIGADEIKLEKFTSYDPIKGVTFDRASFSETVQEKFLKPMRYAYTTWSQLDFKKDVRALVDKVDPKTGKFVYDKKGKREQVYANVPLAYAMFGRELLDIPQFRYKKKIGGIDADKVLPKLPGMTQAAYDDMIYVKENGYFKINYDVVNTPDGKAQLYKQIAKGRIAAELYSHRSLYSTDPRYNFHYYETVIKALESIPGEVLGDEHDMQTISTAGRFFKKDDIKWIRKKSKTTKTWLYGEALLTATVSGSWKGFRKVFSDFVEGVFFK